MAALLFIAFVCAACGKKGAPMPPLLRLPAAAGEPAAVRVGNDVFVRFTVPTANADGNTPADINRVEVYAITADRAPTVNDDFERLRRVSTLIATHQVRLPLPPQPPLKPGEKEPPPMPQAPGIDQGASVVVRDEITEATRAVVPIPTRAVGRTEAIDVEPLPGPVVVTMESRDPIRYYYAVGVSPNGRYGLVQQFLAVPLGTTSGAPSAPTLTHDEKTITIRWTAPPDVRGVSRIEPIPDALPAKPLFEGPPATTYDVYEVPRETATAGNQTPAMPSMPTPITTAPVGALEVTQPITAFGVERCFFVRSVDIVNGIHVRGPASPVACITPKDTFPPAAPTSLAAVASAGAVNLIWEPAEDQDLAGYIVLRGEGAGATLTPLTPAPISETTFVDRTVSAGRTYTYAVIAVDKAGNRSPESNRVEETAR